MTDEDVEDTLRIDEACRQEIRARRARTARAAVPEAAPLLSILSILAEVRAPNEDARAVALWGLHLARQGGHGDPQVFEAFARQLLRLQ